jgi:hypothetical protein
MAGEYGIGGKDLHLSAAVLLASLVGNSVYSFSFEGKGIGRNQKELKELQIFPIPYCNLEQRNWKEFSKGISDSFW